MAGKSRNKTKQSTRTVGRLQQATDQCVFVFVCVWWSFAPWGGNHTQKHQNWCVNNKQKKRKESRAKQREPVFFIRSIDASVQLSFCRIPTTEKPNRLAKVPQWLFLLVRRAIIIFIVCNAVRTSSERSGSVVSRVSRRRIGCCAHSSSSSRRVVQWHFDLFLVAAAAAAVVVVVVVWNDHPIRFAPFARANTQ